MSPEQVKDLTLPEVFLYTSDERSLSGGTRSISANILPHIKGSPKKYLDPKQRARELYEQRYGQSAPW